MPLWRKIGYINNTSVLHTPNNYGQFGSKLPMTLQLLLGLRKNVW